ncbi:MAG TPA: hypothetical protein VKB79_24995 [Bryobacteraceae bacterium]|nr:hypothetical protein [Bryobacteraceae bacterium]
MAGIEEEEMPIPFGVSAETGLPLPGLDAQSIADFSKTGDDESGMRRALDRKATGIRGVSSLIRDPNQLSQTGWAVIFSASADARIQRALKCLLDHRRAEVRNADLFRQFSDVGTSDTAESWLQRFPSPIDPTLPVKPSLGLPYYVLIVAPPHEITFDFQYSLDIQWAVGRIWFEDEHGVPVVEEFERYAKAVVDYETSGEAQSAREMALFAPRHDFELATQAFADCMATPLSQSKDIGASQGFPVRAFIGEGEASRRNLAGLFTREKPPALIFSGSHGKAIGINQPELQARNQGAIICQEWRSLNELPRDAYFTAEDLAKSNCNVAGMIHFFFACYGGGWPANDTYLRRNGVPEPISQLPKLARLPQALLAHGALAVLAHIDRAFAYSFRTGREGQIQGFEDVIGGIMNGYRLGRATDQFNARWSILSKDLLEKRAAQDELRASGLEPTEKALKAFANRWVARNDARNYVVIGDPAVRLREEIMPGLTD